MSGPISPLVLEVRFADDQLSKLADLLAERMHSGAERTKPYTPVEVAKALGLSTKTIRRRIEAGIIKTIPDMGRVLVSASEVKRIQGGDVAR